MKNNFESVWGRIREETGIKSLQSLADILKKTQPAISKAKAKGEFPPGWAYLVAKEFGLLTEWVLTGEGQKRPGKIESLARRKFEILDRAEEWLAQKVKENPKNEIWFEVEFEEKFQEFKKWKEEKEESEAREASTTNRKVA